MNCRREGCPDCYHISYQDNRWFCDTREARITNPDVDGCLYYEASGEHQLKVALQTIYDRLDKIDVEHEKAVQRIFSLGFLYLVAIALLAIGTLVWSIT